MKFLRGLPLVLLNGFILMFYSELVFWSRPRPEDSLPNWLSTWVAYSILGFLFLAAIRHFHVGEIWSLFLCGAIFGWLAEGVVVQTMYASFPLQISWTGLAWHALISVWFGWYCVRAAILSNRFRRVAWVNLCFGLAWGFWAVSWWYEDPGSITSPWIFGKYAVIASLLLGVAYFLFDRLEASDFRAPPIFTVLVLLFFGGLFIFFVVPATPASLVLLPPLLILSIMALSRNRHRQADGDLLDRLTGRAQLTQYLAMLLAPLTASLVYWLAWGLPWHLPTGWVVYLLVTPLGALLFIVSLVKTWRKKPIQAVESRSDTTLFER